MSCASPNVAVPCSIKHLPPGDFYGHAEDLGAPHVRNSDDVVDAA